MKTQPKKNSQHTMLISCGVVVLLIATSVFGTKLIFSDDKPKRRRTIQAVKLVTPPPPKVEKKLPEPEPEVKQEAKKELIETPVEQQDQAEPETSEADNDEPAPAGDLGLDADGGSGTDGFGLAARKGGRSVIGAVYGNGTGSGNGALMRKYGWYTSMLQDELRKKVNEYLEKNGGTPEGDIKTVVMIKLDDSGNVMELSISGSSGDEKLDKAVTASLKMAKISEPPPDGMPRMLKLKISAKG